MSKDGVQGFMEYMTAGRIHYQMVRSKEVITENRIGLGHLAEDKRKGKGTGGKG